MIKSIRWHKNYLEAKQGRAHKMWQEIERLKEKLFKIDNDLRFLSYQIEEAEKAGKDGFDRNKYKISPSDPNEVLVRDN